MLTGWAVAHPVATIAHPVTGLFLELYWKRFLGRRSVPDIGSGLLNAAVGWSSQCPGLAFDGTMMYIL